MRRERSLHSGNILQPLPILFLFPFFTPLQIRSRLILLQENNEKQEERLAKATLELAGACLRADSNVRKRTELENAVSSNEETIDNLDKQLSESKITLSDSENKFEDISRKLATLEADAARGNERAEGAEKKIKDIEEELRVVGANMQQLEIGEEKTMAREEGSQVQKINNIIIYECHNQLHHTG